MIDVPRNRREGTRDIKSVTRGPCALVRGFVLSAGFYSCPESGRSVCSLPSAGFPLPSLWTPRVYSGSLLGVAVLVCLLLRVCRFSKFHEVLIGS